MRRFTLFALCIILGAALGAGAVYLIEHKNNTQLSQESKSETLDSANNWELLENAYLAVSYIKQGDYSSLSKLVHSDYGLVFSPYSNISLSSSQCFTIKQIESIPTDDTVYIWGVINSSGEAIELTPSEYFKKYVYARDYANASVIGVNRIVRSGNALENLEKVFPDSKFVDFYIPGDTENGREINWSILRLVFENQDDELKLTAIIHSEYTV